MRTVRIWVKLRCSPEQLFGLDVLAVICQKKPEVIIRFRVRFVQIDCFTKGLFCSFRLTKSIMRGPQKRQAHYARIHSKQLFKPRFRLSCVCLSISICPF